MQASTAPVKLVLLQTPEKDAGSSTGREHRSMAASGHHGGCWSKGGEVSHSGILHLEEIDGIHRDRFFKEAPTIKIF